jgi:hypothetical protein
VGWASSPPINKAHPTTKLTFCGTGKMPVAKNDTNPNLKKNAIISTLIAKLIPPAEKTGK